MKLLNNLFGSKVLFVLLASFAVSITSHVIADEKKAEVITEEAVSTDEKAADEVKDTDKKEETANKDKKADDADEATEKDKKGKDGEEPECE